MSSQNLSPQRRGLKKFLAKKFVESAGIFFTLLLVFSAIVFAFTTWSPGGPPQAAPGEGNIELKEALWTKNGPAKIFYNGGDVGIGTTSPGAKMDVAGQIKIRGGSPGSGKVLTSDSSGLATWQTSASDADNLGNHTATQNIKLNNKWLSGDGGNEGVFVKSNGNVGIGTAEPGQKLDVIGNVRATAFLYSSDKRLKKDVQKIDDALGKIQQLEGVLFKWKENSQPSLGLIAQDLEEVFPELVSTNENTGLKSVQYGNLIAPLIEAIKEQQEQIKELKQEIELLKN